MWLLLNRVREERHEQGQVQEQHLCLFGMTGRGEV
jgi:hypothetical protein